MAKYISKKAIKAIEAAYNKNGVASACDQANKYNVPYEYCKQCEADAPSDNHICIICGQKTT